MAKRVKSIGLFCKMRFQSNRSEGRRYLQRLRHANIDLRNHSRENLSQISSAFVRDFRVRSIEIWPLYLEKHERLFMEFGCRFIPDFEASVYEMSEYSFLVKLFLKS